MRAKRSLGGPEPHAAATRNAEGASPPTGLQSRFLDGCNGRGQREGTEDFLCRKKKGA